jgi:putative oxidoreductase
MSLLARLAKTTDSSSALGLLVVRLWFGLVLAINHGWPKMTTLEKLTASVDKLGFPLPTVFAFGAAASELVGGLLIAVGLLTRPAAVAVVVTMLVAAFVVHSGDPFMKKEFALCYAAAALALLVSGPGKLSLDVRLSK